MAVRKCPQCLAMIPAGDALAYSNSMECPGCKSRLEVADGSRHIATLAGLLAGLLVWRLTAGGESLLEQVLPVVYAILAFGIVAPLTLAFSADLRLRPEAPPDEPVAASHGGAHGHGGGHH